MQVIRASGIITAAVAAAWTDLDNGGTAASRPLDVVLPGMSVGDKFSFKPNVSVASASGGWLANVAVVVNGAVVRRLFDATFGHLPWSVSSAVAGYVIDQPPLQVVQTGDLESGGQLRLRLQYIQATAARTVNATAGIPLTLEGRGPFV